MKYQMECIYKRENNVHYNDIWMEKTKKQRWIQTEYHNIS